jgi:hypothetical protein
MPVTPKPEHHIHEYSQRSYAPDGPVTNDNYNLEPRYILFRKCKCGDKYAYDLVREKPEKALA